MGGGQVSCWTKRGGKRAGMCSRAILYVCSEVTGAHGFARVAVHPYSFSYPEPGDVLNVI